MARIIFLIEKQNVSEGIIKCQNVLKEMGHKVSILYYDTDSVTALIQSHDYDLVFVENLLGYDNHTLTGDVRFNFASGKVYNLITEPKCENEGRLNGLISIAHFFYCVDKDKYEEWNEKYPHVDHIEYLEGWSEAENTNGAILAGSICSVLKKCYID